LLKILVVDDHSLFVEGMFHVLNSFVNKLTFLHASCAKDGLAIAAHHSDIAIVLLDLDLPDVYGLKALEQFKQNFPLLPVVILSASDKQADMCQAMNSGAKGYIHKASKGSVLVSVIKLVLAGGIYIPPSLLGILSTFAGDPTAPARLESQIDTQYAPNSSEIYSKLTSRQREILNHITSGLSNKEIAYRMDIAESTVKAHVAAVLKVLKVTNRTKAAQSAHRFGIKVAG